MKVAHVPTSKLLKMGQPWNPRRISAHDLEALRRSMRYFGTVEPIVVNKRSGKIVGGHQRVKAAEAEGITELPVVHVDLDEPSERQLNLALNRITGQWDVAMLTDLLTYLTSVGADLNLTGFGDEEVAKLLAQLEPKTGKTDPDDIPAPPEKARTKRGDLIELGTHRVLCGDATDARARDRLLGDSTVACLVTDPPYGVSYEGGASTPKKRTALRGDQSANLYAPFLAVWGPRIHFKAPTYIWFAGSRGFAAYKAVIDAGLVVRSLIIWHKLKAHYGAASAQYLQKHEPCLYCVGKSGAPFYGPTNEVTVWEVEQPSRNELHPTQKPAELMRRAIRNSTKTGDVVADPFLGSGTTLIAAEQLSRSCYGMELEPRYVDVIIKRWERFTGRRAKRVRS